MSVWEKTKELTRTSAAIVSEKARDMVAASLSVVHGDTSANSEGHPGGGDANRLAAEVDQLRRAIAVRLTALGGDVYLLYSSGKRESLEPVIRSQAEALEKLREDLERKEQALSGM